MQDRQGSSAHTADAAAAASSGRSNSIIHSKFNCSSIVKGQMKAGDPLEQLVHCTDARSASRPLPPTQQFIRRRVVVNEARRVSARERPAALRVQVLPFLVAADARTVGSRGAGNPVASAVSFVHGVAANYKLDENLAFRGPHLVSGKMVINDLRPSHLNAGEARPAPARCTRCWWWSKRCLLVIRCSRWTHVATLDYDDDFDGCSDCTMRPYSLQILFVFHLTRRRWS